MLLGPEEYKLPRKGNDQGNPQMISKRQIEIHRTTKIEKSISKYAKLTQLKLSSPFFPSNLPTSCSPVNSSSFFQLLHTENSNF